MTAVLSRTDIGTAPIRATGIRTTEIARTEPYDEGGRVSMIEVIAYTAVLGFIALFASGLFDGMVAWQ
jgi:hypothetical protein